MVADEGVAQGARQWDWRTEKTRTRALFLEEEALMKRERLQPSPSKRNYKEVETRLGSL